MGFNISGARSAGYSDDDIVQELQNTNAIPFNYAGATKAGYSPTEILDYLDPNAKQPSGYVDQMKQGIADVAGGIGKTIDVHSSPGGYANEFGKWLESKGHEAAPTNFTPANLTGNNGKLSNLGLWLARQTPAAAGALGAGLLATFAAPESVIAGGTAAALGAGGAGFAMSAGDEAQEAADRRTGKPNSPVTNADLVRGDLTAAAENAVGALPAGRYLGKLAGPLERTGMAGVVNAGKRLLTTAGEQGAANAGADVVHQVGQSVGTPQGVSIDPSEVVGAGIGGATVGGLFGAKGAAREALDAAKYSGITPALRPAAAQVANRVQQNADGKLLGGVVLAGKAQRVGEEAVRKTGLDINNELGTAVSDLRSRVNLPVDADNVLKSVMNGQQPTEQGYAVLQKAMGNDPQAANVLNLVQQKHAFDVLNDSGQHINGKFTGGIAGKFRSILTGEHVAKSAMVGLGAAALEEGAGHLIAYSPQALFMAAGGAALARMMDNITKAQTPAGRFVRNFGSPEAGVRLTVPQVPQEPINRVGPTGPKIAPEPSPWSGGPAPFVERPVASGSIIPDNVRNVMNARATLAKLRPQMQSEATTEPLNPTALPTSITGGAKNIMRGAANAARMREEAAVPVAPEATSALNPMALPTAVTGPAKNIMRGAAIAARMRDQTLGQEAAEREIANSPLIEQKLNGQQMPTPQAAKFMRQGIGSANTMAKIQSDPEADAQAREEARAVVAENKRSGRIAEYAEKQRAKAEAMVPVMEAKAKAAAAKLEATKIRLQEKEAKAAQAKLKAEAKAKGAPKAVKEQSAEPQIAKPTSVSKANGKTKTSTDQDDYAIPHSAYAHLTPIAAAHQVVDDMTKAGTPPQFKNGAIKGIVKNITNIRNLAAELAREAPGVNAPEVAAQFEGVSSQADAIKHREWLKKQIPQAATALDHVFSDSVIQGKSPIGVIWKRKGK